MLSQFTLNANKDMILLEANFTVGASGAVTLLKGTGTKSIVRLGAGRYKVTLNSAKTRHLGTVIGAYSPAGSSVAATSAVASTVYQILTVGTTTQAQWVAAGMPASVTAAPGVVFLASGPAAGGTGTVAAPAVSGVGTTELCGDPNTTVTTGTSPYYVFQTLSPTSSSVTTPVATDPAQGTVITIQSWYRRSSCKGAGE